MFPDISCDDIFRLETARLWLRWLRVGDASAVLALPGAHSVLADEGDGAHLRPGEVERLILEARKATAAGTALVLGATTKAKNRTFVGVLAAHGRGRRGDLELRYAFAPTPTGSSLATECLAALADACFNLTEARALIAAAQGGDQDDILSAVGFSPEMTGGILRLQRRDWMRAHAQRLPDMSHQGERPLRDSASGRDESGSPGD